MFSQRRKSACGLAVTMALLPGFVLAAALPAPRETEPIPQPAGYVNHVVEKPSVRRPLLPLPPNTLSAPLVPGQNVATNNTFDPVITQQDLPLQAPARASIILTLRDAILLALRYNPIVEQSQLTRINDKYNLYLVQRDFVPTYTLSSGATFTSANKPQYNVAAGVNVRTPLGTQLGLNYANTFPAANGQDFGTVTFSATQPLLQGFGFVNKIPLLDAYDTESTAKLNYKLSIIAIVTQVIQSYRALVSDYNNLDIQISNLKSTKITTDQYRLQLKAGKMAVSDLVQQQAQLAQAQLSYEQQRILVDQDYRAFLELLGLTLDAKLDIDRKIDLGNFRIPSVKAAVQVALCNNIAYQEALLNLKIIERNVILMKNLQLPNLTVAATQTYQPPGVRPAVGGIPGMGFVSNSTVTVNLTVPIDNVAGKANFIAARIAAMQAKLALTQAKETLVSTILNDLAQLKSLREQVRISKASVAFQEKTFQNFELKLKYGKATVNEVTQNQTLYINQALQLVSLEISYLDEITTFRQDCGITLDAWNIKLRY